MNSFFDIFRWDRFVATNAIEVLFWLVAGLSVLGGGYGVLAGVHSLQADEVGGLIVIALSIIGGVTGIVFARILCEAIVILFRINDNLADLVERDADAPASDDNRDADWARTDRRPAGAQPERRDPLAVELAAIDHRVAAAEAMDDRLPDLKLAEARNWETRETAARRVEPRSWDLRAPEPRAAEPASRRSFEERHAEPRHPEPGSHRAEERLHAEARRAESRGAAQRPAEPRRPEPHPIEPHVESRLSERRATESRPPEPRSFESRLIEGRASEVRPRDARPVDNHTAAHAARPEPAPGSDPRHAPMRPADRLPQLPQPGSAEAPRHASPAAPREGTAMRSPDARDASGARPALPPTRQAQAAVPPRTEPARNEAEFVPPRDAGSIASDPARNGVEAPQNSVPVRLPVAELPALPVQVLEYSPEASAEVAPASAERVPERKDSEARGPNGKGSPGRSGRRGKASQKPSTPRGGPQKAGDTAG
ncbi:hypothetical protein C3941_06745 [Kaistia algarum]|uniref:DUF4282 domain-containing protein n=1 Tax=Kaistia algarum TaxID=2083279 RepID=UPI000CE7EDCA|nr:DUF4282 domain-containing protein [Kaistia algarum]MCX5515627.1 DUF4282 domain-containing protein [Kaistia algarum]PPE80984.1 hypothetical protein C3941_06745 [Kaistia algarum]